VRIALYYPWLYLTSGAERTILEIARRSRHRVTVFTNEYQPEATFPELRGVEVRVLERVPVKRDLRSVARAAATILGQRLDLDGFDALLVVCEGLGDFTVLRRPPVPAFCLCLTPLRIAFDPFYRANYLAEQPVAKRLMVRVGSAVFRVADRRMWRSYRRIFPISEEVRRRILAGRLAPEAKLEVLQPGIDLSAFVPSTAEDRTFFLPGRIMWTKNLELAIDGFKRFRARQPGPNGWRLRIAGIVDRKSQPYLEKLQRMAGGDPAIEFMIRPTDEEMLASYRSCFATLFTAFNEDWGLVVIEAMASAKPVIAVNRGGPREIVRHGHDGLLVEPDPEHFADAMHRLASEPGLYETIAGNGPPSAARFDCQAFVDRLDTAIETGIGGR
jgi:glycosyltransferase involved in cell wall biosynthesis